MGKNGGSKAGSDMDPEGVVEIDPTQRYLRVCICLFVLLMFYSYIFFNYLMDKIIDMIC